jgi:hypothetical protein
MRGHAQQNNLSCRLAGAKKGVRFNVTPPYARSHQPGLNAFWTVQILATPTFRNTPVYFFVYESALSGQIEEGCEQLLIAVFS